MGRRSRIPRADTPQPAMGWIGVQPRGPQHRDREGRGRCGDGEAEHPLAQGFALRNEAARPEGWHGAARRGTGQTVGARARSRGTMRLLSCAQVSRSDLLQSRDTITPAAELQSPAYCARSMARISPRRSWRRAQNFYDAIVPLALRAQFARMWQRGGAGVHASRG